MKKQYLFVFIIGIFATNNVFSQNNFWTFPEQYLIPAGGPQYLPTSDYNGYPSEYTHAGIMDPYGEIIFFMIDGRIYDKNGQQTPYPFYNGSVIVEGQSETLIVPQPGSCSKFYIFQAGRKNG